MLPKRGTFVPEWSAGELAERFEVMAEMESVCARLAARPITEAELADFEAVHQECRGLAEAGDIDAYYLRNSDFHHCIYRATHKAFLEQEAARLHAMLQPYRCMQLQVRNRMARSLPNTTRWAPRSAPVTTRPPPRRRAAMSSCKAPLHDLLAALRRSGHGGENPLEIARPVQH